MIIVDLLAALLWGFCCAISGVVYASVLPAEDTPLNPWFRLLEKHYEAGGWKSWIAGVLGACEKCVSGQLALWSSSALIPWAFNTPSIAVHILSAATAVLCAIAIRYGYKWISNQL